MKFLITSILVLLSAVSFSQRPDTTKTEAWKSNYRETSAKINDLVHTKLVVSFDLSKCWMYGKATITLKPHFYPTDSLNLDAKGMAINEVSIIKSGTHIPLKYSYDSLNLRITLDKTYKGGEAFTIFIDYISRPNTIKGNGSAAISDNKGLYFINPAGKIKNKPVQIWTQGETESNSVWFPTIDKPNQKTTDEITMTVPGNFQTLSNGLLISKKINKDGTRTDTWKMDLPHAPYLMMMAAGEFSIIKDNYKGKEVNYYVEKEYAPVARKIFGLTPEMIGFYSRITGVEYPWQKYDQIVCRDYVSGAMENTTATLHAESAQQDARQLVDANNWEDIIAHELFHMWFGDYVTTESWSNLTMNESFADYSETLWEEYKHGKDAGDEHNYTAMQEYLFSRSDKLDLVRFYYRDKEDVFDAVSYQKGGRILNMLRNYVGDSAFYKSLNLYLKTKKFQSAEAQDLRLAFEEVTGQDLNWFWNQWYYGSGHPKLDINYGFDNAARTAKVIIKQTQAGKLFKLPVAIDVYQGNNKKRYNVWLQHKVDSFSFPVTTKPDLINVDGDKILLCEKTDNKTLSNYIFQYKNAGLYLDRREAIDFASRKQSDDFSARELMKTALNDRYAGLRQYTMQRLSMRTDSVKSYFEPVLADLAGNDPKSLVRAAAIKALGQFKAIKYKDLYLKSVTDSSYAVSGSALVALAAIDSTDAVKQARILAAQPAKGTLAEAINNVLYTYGNESDFGSLADRFNRLPFGNSKIMMLQSFAAYLKKVNNDNNFRKGIDMIVSFRDSIPKQYFRQLDSFFNGMILNGIAVSKQSAGKTEQADYVRTKLPVKAKAPVVADLTPEVLKSYSGDYDYEGNIVKVVLRDEKNIYLVFSGQTEMELTPVSKTKFNVKLMEGYAVEFIRSEKGDITGMSVFTPDGGSTIAKRK